jgi:hypothetical protein
LVARAVAGHRGAAAARLRARHPRRGLVRPLLRGGLDQLANTSTPSTPASRAASRPSSRP